MKKIIKINYTRIFNASLRAYRFNTPVSKQEAFECVINDIMGVYDGSFYTPDIFLGDVRRFRNVSALAMRKINLDSIASHIFSDDTLESRCWIIVTSGNYIHSEEFEKKYNNYYSIKHMKGICDGP